MMRLESRPTSPVKIAKAIAVGVAVAVPLMMFGAPLIVQVEHSVLRTGDAVCINYGPSDGRGTAEDCTVDRILDNGMVSVTTVKSGQTFTVPREAVEKLW